jgi:dTDP-4-amino-4,6-dideoxygalactose transaminase
VFCDIQEDTLNIDPKTIARRITKKTKAIMVVHWAGYPVDLEEIQNIAKEYKLKIIEDAAHALGARYHGKFIGSISDYTCFSFQAIKQITCGDGGMLAVLNEKDCQRAKILRWYGIDRNFKGDIYWKYQITEIGYKYHMNDINATMLLVQLDELRKVLERRRAIVDMYLENLVNVKGLKLPKRTLDRESGNWLFTILVEKRENFMQKLKENGVESHMVHVRNDIYPIFGGKRLDLPVMNEVEPKYVSIPLHTNLTDEDVQEIIRTIKSGW